MGEGVRYTGAGAHKFVLLRHLADGAVEEFPPPPREPVELIEMKEALADLRKSGPFDPEIEAAISECEAALAGYRAEPRE